MHIALGIVLTAAWVVCLVEWIRRGCPIPRPVQVLALLLLCAGIGVAGLARVAYEIELGTAFLWIALPPARAYVGWLLGLGPWIQKDKNDEMK